MDSAADGAVLGVELRSPQAAGADLTGVPHAGAIADELLRLGFRFTAPRPLAQCTGAAGHRKAAD